MDTEKITTFAPLLLEVMRLDKLLVTRGIFSSRERAQDAIVQKTIAVDGKIIDKPSKEVVDDACIEVIDIFNRYVSRGGLKLEKAVEDFGLDFSGKTVLDVGSSTGGFTDCALKHGAAHVTAVDVGCGQLHPSLQNHPQVQSIENCDFRELAPADTTHHTHDFIVSDVSFISLTYLMPHFKAFLKEEGQLVLLIKPQFEAGPSFLNKSGIVTDDKAYKAAIRRVELEALNHGFHLNNLTISTLFEKVKNVEFLSLFSLTDNHFHIDYPTLFKAIKELRKNLKK
ncbi:MAG: TlyA family RNA methyltransferase [Bacteroidales bacterium]|nr:TlyA family RNA methyltransferase [Bacteroidales bacterium]